MLDRADHPDRQGQRQVLARPVLLARPCVAARGDAPFSARYATRGGRRRCARRPPQSRACAHRRARSPPPRSAPRGSVAGTSSATASCTSSVSAALHTPGRCVLAFSTISCACSRSALASTYTWQFPEAAYMTGTVATSCSAAFNPSPPRGMIRSTVSLWVASSASSSRPPPATRLTHPSGSPAADGGLGGYPGKRSVGVSRRGRPAQDDRVTRLQA